MFLKQSTTQAIRFGPFVDSTDGFTAEAALTIAQADMQLSKDGGAFAQKNAAGNATHDTDGWYSTSLDATDTATVGELIMQVVVTGALPVWVRYYVVEESIYDSLFASAAAGFDTNQRVNVGQWLSQAVTLSTGNKPDVNIDELKDSAQSATDLQDFADAGYDPATNKVQGVVLVDTTTTNTDMRGTDNAALASVLGALADAAAAGDPTAIDTVMAYAKQLINILVGTAGVATFPAESAPGNAVSLAEVIRAIHADVTGLNGGSLANLDAAVSTRATPAQVNAEVLDVLNVDTFAEPGSVPAATATIVDMVHWLYTLSRNKGTQTTTTKTLRNDADSADIATASITNAAGTFTRNEYT